MKEQLIEHVIRYLQKDLDSKSISIVKRTLAGVLSEYDVSLSQEAKEGQKKSKELLSFFIGAKKVEGCSENTLLYYEKTLTLFLKHFTDDIEAIGTNEIRRYLSNYQEQHNCSKVTIDNVRRILSSFFSWLEDEDYIRKSPVRRIHKVRTDVLIKEVISDEEMERLRDSCSEIRDLAMIDLLSSTGMRVGELVKLNRSDVNFQERQCLVFGKGNKEREVYFNARAKIHLREYLDSRVDDSPALFVSMESPFRRLTISGIESRIRNLGKAVGIQKLHPHKFRRTLATNAIDKGMPIEQVQKLLGHVKIDTTLHYAMVNQSNVKQAHRKFIP